jgi:hypothetical protein
LAYRAKALRDQLLELEGLHTTCPSAIERVHMALIDQDEALQQVRGDLERARTVATDWEAEVSVRNVVPTLTSNKRQGLSLNGRC